MKLNESIIAEWQPYISTTKKSITAQVLECDGLTRVITYILQKHNIEHKVCIGTINKIWHMWVQIGDLYIDYRAKMWLDLETDIKNIPHGIFDPKEYSEVEYCINKSVDLEVGDIVFQALTD